jgi:hypothetical protein
MKYNFKKLSLPKVGGKATVSERKLQNFKAVCKQQWKGASLKIKLLLAILTILGCFSGTYKADCSHKNCSRKMNIRVSNDSIFSIEVVRKVEQDTTFVLHVSKES